MNDNDWLDELADRQMRRDWCITLPGGHHDVGDEDDLPDTRGYDFVREDDIPESASFWSEDPEMRSDRMHARSDAEVAHADELAELVGRLETIEERLYLMHAFYRRETGSPSLDDCLCGDCREERRPVENRDQETTVAAVAPSTDGSIRMVVVEDCVLLTRRAHLGLDLIVHLDWLDDLADRHMRRFSNPYENDGEHPLAWDDFGPSVIGVRRDAHAQLRHYEFRTREMDNRAQRQSMARRSSFTQDHRNRPEILVGLQANRL